MKLLLDRHDEMTTLLEQYMSKIKASDFIGNTDFLCAINSPMKYYSPIIDPYNRNDILADLAKWRNGFTDNSNMAVELIKLSQISPAAFGILITRQWAYYEFRLIRYAMRTGNMPQALEIFRRIHRVTTDNPILLEIDEPDLTLGDSCGYRTFERRSYYHMRKWERLTIKNRRFDYKDIIKLINTNYGAFCEWYRRVMGRYDFMLNDDIRQLQFKGVWFDRNAKKQGKRYTVDEVHESVAAYWHCTFNGLKPPQPINFEEKIRYDTTKPFAYAA